MSDRDKLIERVESFYVDIIEGYKEIELQLIQESKLLTMFKKADYDGRIASFKNYKKLALQVETKDLKLDQDDEAGADLKTRLERCLTVFNALCDAHVSMQDLLKRKAKPKNGVKMSDYKKVMDLVRSRNLAMQTALHDLDIVYAEYTDEEDYGND